MAPKHGLANVMAYPALLSVTPSTPGPTTNRNVKETHLKFSYRVLVGVLSNGSLGKERTLPPSFL